MIPPDDSALLHGRVYDPAKAREYYLRTRHLKGRRAGVTAVPSSSGSQQASVVSGPKRSSKEEIEAQKAALEKRLNRLRDVLAQLVDAAKKRSGVDTSKTDSTKSTSSKDSATKDVSKSEKLTPTQKKEAAKRAHDSYEKNKKTSPNQELQALQRQIKDIRSKIRAAVEDARNKATSQTASKGR